MEFEIAALNHVKKRGRAPVEQPENIGGSPFVGGLSSSVAASRPSSQSPPLSTRTVFAIPKIAQVPDSPVRGRSPTDDSYSRQPATFYGTQKTPYSYQGGPGQLFPSRPPNSMQNLPEPSQNLEYGAYGDSTAAYVPPLPSKPPPPKKGPMANEAWNTSSIYSQPSRSSSLRRPTQTEPFPAYEDPTVPSPSSKALVSGLSAYLGTRFNDQETTKWPHTLGTGSKRPNALDDFSEAFAQMSVVERDLQNSINMSHNEIENRKALNPLSPESINAYKHLMDSPPKRPGSLVASPLGSLTQRKNKELVEQLAKEAFEKILQRDKEFHRLMNDLSGIEQWWLENNRQWELKRQHVERKLETIQEFKEQQQDIAKSRPRKKTRKSFVTSHSSHSSPRSMAVFNPPPKMGNVAEGMDPGNRRRDMSKTDKRSARIDTVDEEDEWEQFQEQIEIQEHDIIHLKGWFVENRMLMKEVWKRFKIMQGDVEAVERAARAYQPREEPSWEFDWIYSENYKTDRLIKRHGLIWWFEKASDHLKEWELYLAEQREHWKERKDRYMALETEYRAKARKNLDAYYASEEFHDRNIQNIRNILIQEPDREDEIEERIQEVLDGRKESRLLFEEQERLLNKIIFSFVVQDNANRFRQNDFNDRHWRVRTVLKIIIGVAKALEIHGYPAKSPDTHCTSQIMKIAYWEAQRQEHTQKFDKLLSDEDILGNPYFTKGLIHQGKEHLRHWDFRNKANPYVKQTDTPLTHAAGAFDQLEELWRLEYMQFALLVENMIKSKNKKNHAQNQTDPVDSWKPKQLPPLADYEPFQLRHSTMPIDDALKILNRRRTTQSYRAGIKIFKFFNSPDIFPFFWGYSHASWTRSEFKKLLRTLIRNEIVDEVLDAFLTYCDYTGELFRITGLRGLIRVSPAGWARAPEARVSDIFERKLTFEAPKGAERLQNLLITNKHKFRLDESNRKWKKKELLRVINRIIPEGTLDLKILDKYCNYWAGVGKMFVSTYEYVSSFSVLPLFMNASD